MRLQPWGDTRVNMSGPPGGQPPEKTVIRKLSSRSIRPTTLLPLPPGSVLGDLWNNPCSYSARKLAPARKKQMSYTSTIQTDELVSITRWPLDTTATNHCRKAGHKELGTIVHIVPVANSRYIPYNVLMLPRQLLTIVGSRKQRSLLKK